jgi:hypothetical protein
MDGLGETLGAESEVGCLIKNIKKILWCGGDVVSSCYVFEDPHLRDDIPSDQKGCFGNH